MIYPVVTLMSTSLILFLNLGKEAIFSRSVMFEARREDFLPEIQQVVFLKVHKAASSTVQNILLRFAMTRKLSVLLPYTGTIINEEGFSISPSTVLPHPEGKRKFDILCNHVVYNEQELSKYFPDDAIRVAILREPMAQALSSLIYYSTTYCKDGNRKGLRKYPADPVNGFLRHPEDFQVKFANPSTSYINNRMSLDLGFDSHDLDNSKNNKTKIDLFIKTIEKQLDFVLIFEYFDESVVLLRRYFRWSMKDILYIKLNERKPNTSSPFERKPNIIPAVMDTFRQFNRVDYELYEYFLPKFLRKIKSEPHFSEEVAAFKLIESKVARFCLSNDTNNVTIDIPANMWTNNFTVSKEECVVMMTPELPLVDFVRQEQLNRRRIYLRSKYTNRLQYRRY